MDRRQLKKYILFYALDTLNQSFNNLDIAFLYEVEPENLTIAQRQRFMELLQEMVDNAEDKLNQVGLFRQIVTH